LNNEFRYADAAGGRRSIAIPPSLLISALGQVDDVTKCVTMDLKEPGNRLLVIGLTKEELGGSHFGLVPGCTGGQVPRVDPASAKRTFEALHRAIQGELVRACHDLSEGGLAVALAEMAFAGGYGAKVDLDRVPCGLEDQAHRDAVLLFSESATRFICEVPPDSAAAFERALTGLPHADIGVVTAEERLEIAAGGGPLRIAADIARLKAAWQAPLDW